MREGWSTFSWLVHNQEWEQALAWLNWENFDRLEVRLIFVFTGVCLGIMHGGEGGRRHGVH